MRIVCHGFILPGGVNAWDLLVNGLNGFDVQKGLPSAAFRAPQRSVVVGRRRCTRSNVQGLCSGDPGRAQPVYNRKMFA